MLQLEIFEQKDGKGSRCSHGWSMSYRQTDLCCHQTADHVYMVCRDGFSMADVDMASKGQFRPIHW